MENDLSSIRKILEHNGYEFTIQKHLILNVLLKSDVHLSAKQIYDKVKEKNIGLATVYRSLKIFKDLKIVKEINDNGINYYEMKIFSKKPLHIHFKCLKCNSIIDIDSKDADIEYIKLNKKIEEQNNIDIYDSNIIFIGLCNKCREELKCQDQLSSEE